MEIIICSHIPRLASLPAASYFVFWDTGVTLLAWQKAKSEVFTVAAEPQESIVPLEKRRI